MPPAYRFSRFFLGVSTNSGTSDSESLPLPAIERSLKDSLLLLSISQNIKVVLKEAVYFMARQPKN